jgi:hypothetical protein
MAKCVFLNIVFTAGLFILAFSVLKDLGSGKADYDVQRGIGVKAYRGESVPVTCAEIRAADFFHLKDAGSAAEFRSADCAEEEGSGIMGAGSAGLMGPF